MSLPRPNESYHFQANLIWWDSPFNTSLKGYVVRWKLAGVLTDFKMIDFW